MPSSETPGSHKDVLGPGGEWPGNCPSGPVSRETVRNFIITIAAQAKAALAGMEKPGYLQMSWLHPASKKLVPSRYRLDDVERMIADAVVHSQAGRNVYIEGRTIREDAPRGNRRGKLEDTAAVFALVIDSDADKGMGWTPPATVQPSMTVETSPGNFQFWFFLSAAVGADIGQQLGERIRKAVGCDHDTGNVVQPYRVAGTANYPDKKKCERGRIMVPTHLVEFNPEMLWTPELIEKAFPLPTDKANDSNKASGNGTQPDEGKTAAGNDAQPDEGDIPPDTMRVIRDGTSANASSRDRSHTFWNVMMALKRVGFSVDGIVNLLERYPNGIAKKYEGRLRQEVERDYNKLLNQAQQYGYGGQAAAATAPEIVFDPWARYVVPAFPFDILPPLVQDYIGAQARIIGCDPSAMAMTTLGTFSGALHHGFALKILRNGEWYASPRLWILLVAAVSQRKTPMLKASTRPLIHYEADLRDKYRQALRDYKQSKKKGDEGVSASQMQEPEPPPRYLAWDTTVEKLGETLARGDGRKGLLVLADEVSGWLGSMERYSHSGGRSDRAFWLQAYDGGSYSVERISRGETYIQNLSVSIMGGIQPTRLPDILGLTSDGLLQRFVPVMVGPAKFRQDCACNDEGYSQLVRDMIFAKPERLIMTDGALAIMEELHRHLFDLEQASEGLAIGFPGFVGKLLGLAGSLALILHMAHHLAEDPQLPGSGVADPVSEHTVEGGPRPHPRFHPSTRPRTLLRSSRSDGGRAAATPGILDSNRRQDPRRLIRSDRQYRGIPWLDLAGGERSRLAPRCRGLARARRPQPDVP